MNTNDNYNENNRLQELGGSDFQIAEGEPNIKGWTVKDQQGRTVGEVDELLFDPQSRKVRYIVLDLEGNVLDLEPRHVLVPIGVAELHDSDDDVILPNVTAAQFQSLPVYEKGNLTRDTENSIRSVFSGAGAAGAGVAAAATGAAIAGQNRDDDYYNDEFYDEEKLYRNRRNTPPVTSDTDGTIPVINEEMQVGKREVETGSTHIRSRIVERPVEEHIKLREEHVDIERTPVDRPATDADLANVREQDITITERAEEAVVNKEARVVEEISLNKEVEEHDETIRGTVRNTEIEIDKLDQDNLRTNDPDNDDYLDTDDPRRRSDL